MFDEVNAAIDRYGLIESGDKVLCAVSGGADSVVLLFVLNTLAKKRGFTLFAAHYNHSIRGEEADRDEQFVRGLCERLGVLCVVKKEDVPKYAKEHGYTLEQAGRILRYEFFYAQNADKIAVAHHMDDQSESIMMHIVRGSGTSGICGMRYMRDKIIRPLLSVRRSEIEQFASENNLEYCTDKTNFIADGTRNKLRLNIIPEIADSVNGSFVEALCSMADIVRTDDDYLYEIAKKELEDCRCEGGYLRYKIEKLSEPIRRRVLRLIVQEEGAPYDIEQKHIVLIEKLLCANTGNVLYLPHIVAWTSYEKICFATHEKYVTITDVREICVDFCIGEAIPFEGRVINSTVIEGNTYSHEKNTVYVDLDLMPRTAVVRNRRNGDRISPLGMQGSKKLKDFYIDRKIDRQNRNMPLICDGDNVLCILGYTVARSVMVTEKTVHMLKITFNAEASNGEI